MWGIAKESRPVKRSDSCQSCLRAAGSDPCPGVLSGLRLAHNCPEAAAASGIHGTPEQLRARIEELVEMGANHLLLNPVCRYAEQVEALAEVVGLHGRGN